MTPNFEAARREALWLRRAWAQAVDRKDLWDQNSGWDEFYRRMDAFDAAESGARRAGAVGCVWGAGEKCRDDDPVTCQHCVTIAASVPQRHGRAA